MTKEELFLEFPSPTFQTCRHTCELHTLSFTSQCISQQQAYEPQAVCACVFVNTKQNTMDTTAQEEFPRCVHVHVLYLTRFSWLRAFTPSSSPRMYFTSSTPFILYSSTMIDREKNTS